MEDYLIATFVEGYQGSDYIIFYTVSNHILSFFTSEVVSYFVKNIDLKKMLNYFKNFLFIFSLI